MNYAHLHLVLNHIPVVGSGFGMFLLVVAFLRGKEELKRVALAFLILTALTAIPAYLTGEPAEELVENLPGVSEAVIERHEEAAQFSLLGIEALGVLSLTTLIASRLRPKITSSLMTATLLLSMVVIGLLGWTANLGGQIRHSEIRAEAVAAYDSDG